jgi:hypothetical protein
MKQELTKFIISGPLKIFYLLKYRFIHILVLCFIYKMVVSFQLMRWIQKVYHLEKITHCSDVQLLQSKLHARTTIQGRALRALTLRIILQKSKYKKGYEHKCDNCMRHIEYTPFTLLFLYAKYGCVLRMEILQTKEVSEFWYWHQKITLHVFMHFSNVNSWRFSWVNGIFL